MNLAFRAGGTCAKMVKGANGGESRVDFKFNTSNPDVSAFEHCFPCPDSCAQEVELVRTCFAAGQATAFHCLENHGCRGSYIKGTHHHHGSLAGLG